MKTETTVLNLAAPRRGSGPASRPAAATASAGPGAEPAVILHHEATTHIEEAILPGHATLDE